METDIALDMPFTRASEIWLYNHSAYIKPRTHQTYGQYLTRLCEFFQQLPLGDFTIGNVRAYQRWREQKAGAQRINAELTALIQVLKEVNHWKSIQANYRTRPVSKIKVRQNMSAEQEKQLVAVALDGSKPRRLLAGHCLILMANTSMGFGELRHLRREDCFLNEDPPHITVNGGTKNDYRIRDIPLNFLALRSARWIVKRWEELGGSEPEQYILPHHARRSDEEKRCKGHKRKQPPIFTEPMGHIYRAARSILKEAGLSHLDPYDMRSHCITKLLSDPQVSEQMYTEIVGHVSKKMRTRYSKQRLENKRVHMEKMCVESAEIGRRLVSFPGGRAVQK